MFPAPCILKVVELPAYLGFASCSRGATELCPSYVLRSHVSHFSSTCLCCHTCKMQWKILNHFSSRIVNACNSDLLPVTNQPPLICPRESFSTNRFLHDKLERGPKVPSRTSLCDVARALHNVEPDKALHHTFTSAQLLVNCKGESLPQSIHVTPSHADSPREKV